MIDETSLVLFGRNNGPTTTGCPTVIRFGSFRMTLVINTSTTIVTFLMVFLIQQTQNKDSKAMELKLNELVAATKGASNRLIDVESLSEDELDVLHGYFQQLAALAKRDSDLTESHSLEEADRVHASQIRP